jgi:hypothetical protein
LAARRHNFEWAKIVSRWIMATDDLRRPGVPHASRAGNAPLARA